MSYINILGEFLRSCANRALTFAASDLAMRAGYASSAANHGYGHAFCLHARPGIACPAPYIRNPMRNPA